MYNPEIFRTYDIRGLAGQEFDEDFVAELAGAFADYVRSKNLPSCCVGRDGRKTSPGFYDIFIESLAENGINVYKLGEVTTPMGYFACFQEWSPNCVVITASHNPKAYNGFKLVVNRMALRSELIQELKTILEKRRGQKTTEPRARGAIHEVDIEGAYLTYLKEHFKFKRSHRFLVDCGNGSAGGIARKVFDLFGFDTTILYEEVDGDFPNHIADPTHEKNLQTMLDTLRAGGHDYEFGVGYDGDADRIGVVTPGGQLLYGDQTLLLLAAEMMKKYKRPIIIADVKSSKVLYDGIEKMGGRPLMFKTGHSLIKAKLNETPECPLAGEMSGHVFYKDDFYGYDDAIYVTLRLIRVLEDMNDSLQTWFDGLPKMINTPEMHIGCPESEKEKVVKKLVDVFHRKYPDAKIITVDGVRIEWPDKWALIRASNTTPVLVLRFEAATRDECMRLENEVIEVVKEYVPEDWASGD